MSVTWNLFTDQACKVKYFFLWFSAVLKERIKVKKGETGSAWAPYRYGRTIVASVRRTNITMLSLLARLFSSSYSICYFAGSSREDARDGV